MNRSFIGCADEKLDFLDAQILPRPRNQVVHQDSTDTAIGMAGMHDDGKAKYVRRLREWHRFEQSMSSDDRIVSIDRDDVATFMPWCF